MMVYMAKLLLQWTANKARKPGLFNAQSGKKDSDFAVAPVAAATSPVLSKASSHIFRAISAPASRDFVRANPSQRNASNKLTVPKMAKLARHPA
eukprot:Skav216018  [mRNA]  locus=scaffold417:23581:24960:- [translate_table: standard]